MICQLLLWATGKTCITNCCFQCWNAWRKSWNICVFLRWLKNWRNTLFWQFLTEPPCCSNVKISRRCRNSFPVERAGDAPLRRVRLKLCAFFRLNGRRPLFYSSSNLHGYSRYRLIRFNLHERPTSIFWLAHICIVMYYIYICTST